MLAACCPLEILATLSPLPDSSPVLFSSLSHCIAFNIVLYIVLRTRKTRFALRASILSYHLIRAVPLVNSYEEFYVKSIARINRKTTRPSASQEATTSTQPDPTPASSGRKSKKSTVTVRDESYTSEKKGKKMSKNEFRVSQYESTKHLPPPPSKQDRASRLPTKADNALLLKSLQEAVPALETPEKKFSAFDLKNFNVTEIYHDKKLFILPPAFTRSAPDNPTRVEELRHLLGSPSRTAYTYEEFRSYYIHVNRIALDWNESKSPLFRQSPGEPDHYVAVSNTQLRPVFKQWMKLNRPHGTMLLYIQAVNSVIRDFPLLRPDASTEVIRAARQIAIQRFRLKIDATLRKKEILPHEKSAHLQHLFIMDSKSNLVYMLKVMKRFKDESPARLSEFFASVTRLVNKDQKTYKFVWNKISRLAHSPSELLEVLGFDPVPLNRAPRDTYDLVSATLRPLDRYFTNAQPIASPSNRAMSGDTTSVISSIFSSISDIYEELKTEISTSIRPVSRVFAVATTSMLPLLSPEEKKKPSNALLIARHFGLVMTGNADLNPILDELSETIEQETASGNKAMANTVWKPFTAISNAFKAALGCSYDPVQLKADSDSARQMSSVLTPTIKIALFVSTLLLLILPRVYTFLTGKPWKVDEAKAFSDFADQSRVCLALPATNPSADDMRQAIQQLWIRFRAIPIASRHYGPASRTMTDTILTLTRTLSNLAAAHARVEPTCLFLKGLPATGKTVCSMYFAHALNSHAGLPYEDVYQPVPGSQYHDSWSNQHVTYLEDFLQEKDPQLQYAAAITWFAMISSVPFPLNCAELERKSSTFFSSKYVLSSTNASCSFIASLVVNAQAALRRMHYVVDVENFRGNESDHTQWSFKLDPESHFYEETVAAHHGRSSFTFTEMVQILEAKQRTFAAHYQIRTQHTPAFRAAFPPGPPRSVDHLMEADPKLPEEDLNNPANRAMMMNDDDFEFPSNPSSDDEDADPGFGLRNPEDPEEEVIPPPLTPKSTPSPSPPPEPKEEEVPPRRARSPSPPPPPFVPPPSSPPPKSPPKEKESWFQPSRWIPNFVKVPYHRARSAIAVGFASAKAWTYSLSATTIKILKIAFAAILAIITAFLAIFAFKSMSSKQEVQVNNQVFVSFGPAPSPEEVRSAEIRVERQTAMSDAPKQKLNQAPQKNVPAQVRVLKNVAKSNPAVLQRIEQSMGLISTDQCSHYTMCVGSRDYLSTEHLLMYGEAKILHLEIRGIKYSFSRETCAIAIAPNIDVALVRFPHVDMVGTPLPELPNLVSHFYNGERVKYGRNPALWVRPKSTITTTLAFSGQSIVYNWPDGTQFTTFSAGWAPHRAEPGDCGSVYVYDSDASEGAIVSMLIAGNTDTLAFSANVNRELIEMLRKSLNGEALSLVHSVVQVPKGKLSMGDAVYQYHDKDGKVITTSHISGRHPYILNDRCRVAPPTEEELPDITSEEQINFRALFLYKAPAAVSQRETYGPQKKRSLALLMDKMADVSDPPEFDEILLQSIADEQYRLRLGEPGEGKLTMIEFQDALFGCKYCKPVDPSTSPGFPFTQMINPSTGKTYRENRELYDADTRTYSPLLYQFVHDYIENPDKFLIQFPFTFSLKAELIDAEKAAKGKVRGFYAGSIVRTIGDRMLDASDVYDALQNHNLNNPHTSGVDFNSRFSATPLTELIRLNPDADVLQWDVPNFDMRQFAIFERVRSRAAMKYYSAQHQYYKLKHMEAREKHGAYVCCGEFVYQIHDITTSGEFMTLFSNSSHSDMFIKYVAAVANCRKDLIGSAAQGDDVVALFQKGTLDLQRFVGIAHSLNWPVTTPDKTPEFPRAYTVPEIEFCKRKWINGKLLYPYEYLVRAGGWRKKIEDTGLKTIGDCLREARHYEDNDVTMNKVLRHYIVHTTYSRSELLNAAFNTPHAYAKLRPRHIPQPFTGTALSRSAGPSGVNLPEILSLAFDFRRNAEDFVIPEYDNGNGFPRSEIRQMELERQPKLHGYYSIEGQVVEDMNPCTFAAAQKMFPVLQPYTFLDVYRVLMYYDGDLEGQELLARLVDFCKRLSFTPKLRQEVFDDPDIAEAMINGRPRFLPHDRPLEEFIPGTQMPRADAPTASPFSDFDTSAVPDEPGYSLHTDTEPVSPLPEQAESESPEMEEEVVDVYIKEGRLTTDPPVRKVHSGIYERNPELVADFKHIFDDEFEDWLLPLSPSSYEDGFEFACIGLKIGQSLFSTQLYKALAPACVVPKVCGNPHHVSYPLSVAQSFLFLIRMLECSVEHHFAFMGYKYSQTRILSLHGFEVQGLNTDVYLLTDELGPNVVYMIPEFQTDLLEGDFDYAQFSAADFVRFAKMYTIHKKRTELELLFATLPYRNVTELPEILYSLDHEIFMQNPSMWLYFVHAWFNLSRERPMFWMAAYHMLQTTIALPILISFRFIRESIMSLLRRIRDVVERLWSKVVSRNVAGEDAHE